MLSSTPDPAKLEALRNNTHAAAGYTKWLDGFVIPLIQRVGLKTVVRRAPGKYTITVKLPLGANQVR